ncbi:MAG TPA: FHA domain-containing protein [Polyangiales bacterium]|nr:FHA domain-containing protein [Polyangiales bacterium]
MARFFLRYQAIDLKLDASDFVVGRTAGCHLVLGDALVSRRHAVFRVTREGVEVRDLGSRNGVLVNGARIEGPSVLKDGDQVRVGAQDLVLSSVERDPRDGGTEELSQCRHCGELYDAVNEACTACGRRDQGGPVEESESQIPDTVVVSDSEPRPSSHGAGSLEVLARLADKALGMGRYDEGERLVGSMLNGILSRASGSEGQDRDTLSLASRYALRLAEVTHSPIWIDDTFRLYSTARQLMPADTIDELYRVATKVRYANPRAIRNYVSRLKDAAVEFGVTERFLLQRLEGLERRIVNG